jgi:hypothetical protein
MVTRTPTSQAAFPDKRDRLPSLPKSDTGGGTDATTVTLQATDLLVHGLPGTATACRPFRCLSAMCWQTQRQLRGLVSYEPSSNCDLKERTSLSSVLNAPGVCLSS